MGRLEKLKRQLIEESNKRNLGIEDIEDEIDSTEQDIDTVEDPTPEEIEIDTIEEPEETEVYIDKHNHFHNIDFDDESEDKTSEWEIPVEMLFHGINTGDVSQIEAGTNQIDMPREKEAAILKFANFIGADSYDLHRVADKLDLEQ